MKSLMEEIKTSEEWYKIYPQPIIRDPDGWDRSDYEFSWFEEEITLFEFNKRRMMSTIEFQQ